MNRFRAFRLYRDIHLWLALLLGAPIAAACAAGVPITYWELSDSLAAPRFYPPPGSEPSQSFESLANGVLIARPGSEIVRVYRPNRGQALHVTIRIGRQEREVSIHRATGAVLADRDFSRSFVTRSYDLHTRLWLGEAGLAVAGALAAGLIAVDLPPS